jgi:hypothetical protein
MFSGGAALPLRRNGKRVLPTFASSFAFSSSRIAAAAASSTACETDALSPRARERL